MNRKKYMKAFYELTLINFELETQFINDGCYKNSPLVIVYPYSVEEAGGHPNYNHYRITTETYDDKFWFNYLNYTAAYKLTKLGALKSQSEDLEALQKILFKIIKHVMEISGIKKELLPEIRYKTLNN